jgi:hypothetical protein
MDNNKKVKTIFDHVVDTTVINKTKTTNSTLPMFANIHPKLNQKNIDIETDLKGINKPLSKCNKN